MAMHGPVECGRREFLAGVLACGDGFGVRLLEVQPPNGRAMEWGAWRNGRGLKGLLRVERVP